MKWTRIAANVPSITIFLILVGLLLQYIEYRFYGIDIYKYLDSTEILFSFTPISVLIIPLLIIYAMIYVFYPSAKPWGNTVTPKIESYLLELRHNIERQEGGDKFDKARNDFETVKQLHHENQQTLARLENLTKNSKKDVRYQVILYAALLLFAIFRIYQLYKKYSANSLDASKLSEWDFDFYWVSFGTTLAMTSAFYVLYKTTPFSRNRSMLLAAGTMFLIVFVCYSTLKSNLKAKYFYDGFPKYRLELALKDGRVFQSNDSIQYLNSTRNYHFFQNIKSKEVDIISTDNISSQRLIKLRDGL